MEGKKYRFNKVIFRVTIGMMVVYVLIVGMLFGIKNTIYMNCPSDTNVECINPIARCYKLIGSIEYIFNDCGNYEKFIADCKETPQQVICTQETIAPGTYVGDLPPFLIRNAVPFFFIIIALSFVVNHLLYNRRKNDVHNDKVNN